ncbi:MAG: ATP-binding protein [Phormidesmis sp.]
MTSFLTPYLPALIVAENLIVSGAYFAIAAGISYGIWRNRQAGVSPVVVAVAAIFGSCGLGHGMHALCKLGVPDTLTWQTAADLVTVIVAVRFLSFYESFDLLARISQIAESKSRLESQNDLLQQTIEKLHEAQSQLVEKAQLESQNKLLQKAISELQQTQTQLVQAEKMSSLGQLVAGVAHEINNPVNFIAGNLSHIQQYTHDLLSLISLHERAYSQPVPAIEAKAEEIDLPFIQQDLPKILGSMTLGTERISQIVLSLRNFSRMDEAAYKAVDIHEGLNSTLLILQHRLNYQSECPPIRLIKEYGDLPTVECYAGQLNQVFMNILTNAIDAIEQDNAEQPKLEKDAEICIRTTVLRAGWVEIAIADNGPGMIQSTIDQIFNPFFTTKPIGKGTGIGMSISYQIVVDRHQGKLECCSQLDKGTEFLIQIPIQQPSKPSVESSQPVFTQETTIAC